MSVKIISDNGDKLKLEIEVDISGSMLEAEEKIQSVCNKVGSVSTGKALEQFDTDGTPIIIGEKKIHSKNERE